jgi:hypothetical protein
MTLGSPKMASVPAIGGIALGSPLDLSHQAQGFLLISRR